EHVALRVELCALGAALAAARARSRRARRRDLVAQLLRFLPCDRGDPRRDLLGTGEVGERSLDLADRGAGLAAVDVRDGQRHAGRQQRDRSIEAVDGARMVVEAQEALAAMAMD